MDRILTFAEWILPYRTASTPTGDLAADIDRDAGFPRGSTDYNEILSYLKRKKACSECLAAFRQAYKRYQKNYITEPS